MKRGTRVGQAYVALTVDGSNINDDIEDSLESVDFDKLGDEHGKEYTDSLEARLLSSRKQMNDALRGIKLKLDDDEAIQKGIAKQLAGAFDHGQIKPILDRVSAEFGDTFGRETELAIKTAVSNGLEGALLEAERRGIQFDINAVDVEAMVAEAKKVTAATEALRKKAQDEQIARDKKALDDLWRVRNESAKAHARYLAELERQRVADEKRAQADRIRAEEKAEADRIRADKNLWAQRNASALAHAKYKAQLERGSIDERGNSVSGNQDKSLADRVSKIFGGGSRNNFLNLFGKSLGNVVGLTESFGKTLKNVFQGGQKVASAFSDGLSKAGENATLLQKTMSGFGAAGAEAGSLASKAFASLAASGPAALAAIVVVTAALSVMVSVLGAVVAIATALAATISGALVGSLIVLGGAIGAVVAAGGLLTAAFMSMNDEQQKLLKDAFKPLHETMIGIGQTMIKEMVPAFQTWAENLERALLLVGPLAEVMGKAFAEAGTQLTAAFSGPGFQMMFAALAIQLPAIVKNLSTAFGQFLNGSAGLFAAIMPVIGQFALYLAQVASTFSAWATSTEGQSAIVSFVDRALESLKSLWNAVREVAGFIGDVLFNPDVMAAGNTIFDSIARTFEGFRKKVSEAAANGDLKKWMQDGIKFGEALWGTIEALGGTFKALYNSGVISAIAAGFNAMTGSIRAMNKVFEASGGSINVLKLGLDGVLKGIGLVFIGFGKLLQGAAKFVGAMARIPIIGEKFKGLQSSVLAASNEVLRLGANIYYLPTSKDFVFNVQTKYSIVGNPPAALGKGAGVLIKGLGGGSPSKAPNKNVAVPKNPYQGIGSTALSQTTPSGGGGGGGGRKTPTYKNPYIAFANKLIKEGPGVAAQIRNAMIRVNGQVAAALRDAAKAGDVNEVRSILTDMVSKMKETATTTINTAQDALNSAAESLKSATSKGAAKRALAQVKKAQKDLKAANANQKKINDAAKMLSAQQVTDPKRVKALLEGAKLANATLADYAAAREKTAIMIEDANEKLADAISMRDTFSAQITSSIKSFGALSTTVAQTVNGVEQALTAGDITSNLTDRLARIKKYQDDLRLLLASGLGDEAYKQILEMGIDDGSSFISALLAGGPGAIGQTNALLGQITTISDSLGLEAGNRMYQAGVDAAQGLVDGLNSLSSQLDSAATALGLSIANAVKKALGIKSPSTVLYGLMYNGVGDGVVNGLDAATNGKVGAAADRLASRVAVSPEVAAYASRQGQSPVSGNQPINDIDITVITPTEDPYAVANEVMNDVTGRL